jgi:hypothetical protein
MSKRRKKECQLHPYFAGTHTMKKKSFITDTWNTSSALELSAISGLDEPEKSKFFLKQ